MNKMLEMSKAEKHSCHLGSVESYGKDCKLKSQTAWPQSLLFHSLVVQPEASYSDVSASVFPPVQWR
jgi:hypothetical protein